MTVLDRFLGYVSFSTASDEKSVSQPSTPGQLDLAARLAEELKSIGIADVFTDGKGYTYAAIPATEGMENEPAVGLIAHIDTSPAISGENIRPRIIRGYDGGDITLCEGTVMSPESYPSLREYAGHDLIVTDGTTLLGADDKAGVAEIVTACEKIISENIPHGRICVAFTPDEEIGRGTDGFDLGRFGADYAYTVDGGALGELEYECFNACAAVVRMKGFSIHPGEAKNKMINAARIACEFSSLMPEAQTPEHTEGYEGFFHLCSVSGTEENAVLEYIIRDFDAGRMEERRKFILGTADFLNRKYGEGTVSVTLSESYRNMKEMIEPNMHVVDRAKAAFEKNGVDVRIQPIRGGTDGAMLSFRGLPCPNISAGGLNFHGKFEYIPVSSMEKMTQVICSLVCKEY